MQNALTFTDLDQVSGGNYKEYVKISNAIASRINVLNENDSNFQNTTERLTETETNDWLKKNLNIGVDFGIRVASAIGVIEKFNSSAKYYSVASTTAGKILSESEVLGKIATWNP